MITGLHALLYSRDAAATRRFLADALALRAVDAGHGWLIFAAPPTELAVHPVEGEPGVELYLMCDDLEATTAELAAHGAEVVRAPREQRWGRVTTLRIPGPVDLGIYQPRHPTAIELGR